MEYFQYNEETYIYPGQEPSFEWEKTMLERYDTLTKQSNEILLSIRGSLRQAERSDASDKLTMFLNYVKPLNYTITVNDIGCMISILNKKSETKTEMNKYETKAENDCRKAEAIAEKLMPVLIEHNLTPAKLDHIYVKFLKETDTVTTMVFFYIVVLTLERYKNKCNEIRLDFYIKVCYKYNRPECAKILSNLYYFYKFDQETQTNPLPMPMLLMGEDIEDI